MFSGHTRESDILKVPIIRSIISFEKGSVIILYEKSKPKKKKKGQRVLSSGG